MDDLASATGGTVVTTGSTSAEIATAITNALGALTFTITPFVQGCDPLQLSFNPPSINDVPGGTSVKFDETIKVPADVDLSTLPPDRTIRCTVRFRASGSTVVSQTIAIKVNSRPDCSAVQAQPNILVPPNHQLREVKLSGATDPDGDPLVLTVTGVTQDEPLNGASDGDRYPDAQAGSTSDTVLLRAERSSSGDGRVYKVRFGVSDGLGGSCTGSVAVSAPLNKGGALFAVDSGQTVNSFGPSPLQASRNLGLGVPRAGGVRFLPALYVPQRRRRRLQTDAVDLAKPRASSCMSPKVAKVPPLLVCRGFRRRAPWIDRGGVGTKPVTPGQHSPLLSAMGSG